jgi:ubiquinone/menaquinone biosynthesis C-methylase UbiE
MTDPVGLYDASYGGFQQGVRERVRAETYGEDLGQTSWLTAGEWRTFIGWLDLPPGARVLDVACGSGGPAVYLARTAGVSVVGVDVNEAGVATATALAEEAGLADRASFRHADATEPLPFEDGAFDAVVCIDAINHLPNRGRVLADWRRVLRPEGRLLFTDPILVTGLLTDEEIAVRASVGVFIFALPDEDERLIQEAGFRLLRHEDATENVAQVAGRWKDARARHREALTADEGSETFEGTQRFLHTAMTLASERRLSRHVFVASR